MHKQYLVSGGAGFIGSHLIDRLLANGASVVCVDAMHNYYDVSVKRSNVTRHLSHHSYQFVEADVRDAESMRMIMEQHRPEVVVHLAARAGVRPSLIEPRTYQDVNLGGTLNMLEAARGLGIRRFVNASSSSVYGGNTQTPFRETDPLLNPMSPYGATKLGAEAMVHVYAKQLGFSAASLRFFTVYGPRQRPDMAISKFAHAMLRGNPIDIYGDGTAVRDFTYVNDIVQGIILASQVDFDGHQVFNLGSNEPIELNALVSELENALGVKALKRLKPPQPGDVPLTYASIEKAKRMLGFRPSTNLRQGLKLFARSLVEAARNGHVVLPASQSAAAGAEVAA